MVKHENNYEQQPPTAEETGATELASRSLGKTIGAKNSRSGEKLDKRTPTQNLYLKIFGDLPEHDMDETDIPELLEWLASIPEREEDVIRRHFGIDCVADTYTKIAEDYGVSRSVIQIVGQRALAKLRKPCRAEKIQMLFASRAELRTQIRDLEKENTTLGDQMASLIRELKRERAKSVVLPVGVPEADAPETVSRNLDLDELGLSARAYNTLRRGGIRTVGELLSLTTDEARKIKNLRNSDLDEIEIRLGQIGLPGLSFRDN